MFVGLRSENKKLAVYTAMRSLGRYWRIWYESRPTLSKWNNS